MPVLYPSSRSPCFWIDVPSVIFLIRPLVLEKHSHPPLSWTPPSRTLPPSLTTPPARVACRRRTNVFIRQALYSPLLPFVLLDCAASPSVFNPFPPPPHHYWSTTGAPHWRRRFSAGVLERRNASPPSPTGGPPRGFPEGISLPKRSGWMCGVMSTFASLGRYAS